MPVNPEYLTVTAFNKYIKRKFDVDPYLSPVYITGEISNFRPRPNAHQYFALKDDQSKINVVMWKSAFAKVPFQLEEGMKVNIRGRISVYEPSGSYQLYIDKIEPDGIGSLYQAYAQLKQRLAEEGLFDAKHKKRLPLYPKRIAVITSESGAVIKDIITTTRRRFPIVQLVLFPAIVQGRDAAADIVEQIKRVNQLGGFDTLIVGRGGGSIEDLWPFNEESVVRAIFNCQVPVISSVGHETDTTLADLVADQRAATPTAAAELAVPKLTDVLLTIQTARERILNGFRNELVAAQQRLTQVKRSYVFQQPERLYETYVQQLDYFMGRLTSAFQNQLNLDQQRMQKITAALQAQSPKQLINHHQQQLNLLNQRLQIAAQNQLNVKQTAFQKLVTTLDHLSPLQTMSRGYSYVSKDDHVIKRVQELAVNDQIQLTLVDGSAQAQIIQVNVKEQD